MQTLSDIRALLASHGLRPKRRLGQNFLHDQNQLKKLVDAADVKLGDVVLEVGPGTGTLTEALLERGANVIACEIDPGMAGILRERLGEREGFTLIESDALDSGRRLSGTVDRALRGQSFKLVANLPYQVASPLIATLLMHHPECTGQFVTIQKEVADRLMAKPGTKEYGTLSVIVQSLGEVARIAVVKPGSFWPSPKVTSAMVRITPIALMEASGDRSGRSSQTGQIRRGEDAEAFATFVTVLFSKRRKQLGSIVPVDALKRAGIEPTLRPEALSVEQHVALRRATR